MDIRSKLHNLIARFELCVAKFDPAVHKFRFGKGYIRDEIEWIIEQLHLNNCSMEQINTKLNLLFGIVIQVERKLNISSTSKDIVIDDDKPKLIKTEIFDASITMANGGILYYNRGPVSIDDIKRSVPNHPYKTKGEATDDKYFFPTTHDLKADVVVDDINRIPNLTYGLDAINDVADVVIKNFDVLPEFSVKTFPNRQPTNHKDIVTLKISKPNNDTVIE